MKGGVCCQNLGCLIGHISYNNYEFSNRIAKKILVGINKCNGDEIRPYLEVLEPFLSLIDSFTRQRHEWILGIPVIRIERPIQSFNMLPINPNNMKMGVALINAMNDDIYDYKSTLFKSSSGVKESLLQILYQYRRRWPLYTLQCL